MKVLLHACCGPCSLEPVRELREAGHELTIYYANSNIAPAEEYGRRLSTLLTWAEGAGVPVVEGTYAPADWEVAVAAALGADERAERCRACYRLRFEEAARYAAEQGYDALGTTLSVSPYQYTEIIREELERAAATVGVPALFEDYRPFYDEATRRSRAAGMYRQNYCGCLISAAEAEHERAERKEARAAQRAAAAAASADERAAEEAARQTRRNERAAYDEKRRRQREVLRALREQERAEKPDGSSAQKNASQREDIPHEPQRAENQEEHRG